MDGNKLKRLSFLFEKMVANSASIDESKELSVLYQEYIDDGRETKVCSSSVVSLVKPRVAS